MAFVDMWEQGTCAARPPCIQAGPEIPMFFHVTFSDFLSDGNTKNSLWVKHATFAGSTYRPDYQLDSSGVHIPIW